jgi:hypothetical protein
MLRPLLSALALALFAGALAAQAGEAVLLFRFQDSDLRESSGLTAATYSDDLYFTHNDSGSRPELFAVDGKGRTAARLRVPGATLTDWEDLAVSREGGAGVLWIGDIGDNRARRLTIAVYRVPEPRVGAGRNQRLETGTARKYVLAYPTGGRDAEALLVSPAGRLYVATKSAAGTGVYAAPAQLRENGPNRLTRVGEVQFLRLPTRAQGLKDHMSRLLCTGGAISPDGRRLVLRTYTDAYEWTIPNGDVAAGLRKAPLHIPLPAAEQGEAIAYTRAGDALLTSSEGKDAPVHRITPVRGRR